MAKEEFSTMVDEKTAAAMNDIRPQRRLIKKKRAGVVLTRGEVKAIKIGRKKLRKEMRKQGIKSRKEFELTASSLGLYFDKNKFLGLLLWFFHGRGLVSLLAALAAALTVLYLYSTVTELRGHFTINMNDDLFREGFILSETVDFQNPNTRLYCDPSVDVPCISISDISEEVVNHDGKYEDRNYFAYTFYIRNEGESTVGYDWSLEINSESLDLSKATWAMVFEDHQMRFFAEAREDGTQEALPYFSDNTRGYLQPPMGKYTIDAEKQYGLVGQRGNLLYWRVIPYAFESENVVATGTQLDVEPLEVHKYTVVLWLEGDDPDCTDEMIGGHLGMDMQFNLIEPEETEEKEPIV